MKKNILIGVIVLIIVAIAILRIFTSSGKNKAKPAFGGLNKEAVVPVQAIDVSYGTIQNSREFTGTIKAASTYIISAKVPGRLNALSKRIGDRVGSDEAVGKIEDIEYRQMYIEAKALVAVSKASVTESEAQVKYAEKELSRVSGLVSKGISSQAEYDAAQTQCFTQKSRLDLARAQLDQRLAALDQALTKLNYTTVRSSQAGYIAIRHTDGGAQLSINSPVYTIVGIDTVFVEISVPEKDYSLIKKGQNTLVSVEALTGRIFNGKVTSASPFFQTATRTAVVEIAVVNDSLLLKPGMFARIKLLMAEKNQAQIVTSSAIVNRLGNDGVFVANEKGTAEFIPVKIGIKDGDKVEILSPQINGKVITMGNHLLTNGSKISIVTGSKTGTVKDGVPKASSSVENERKVKTAERFKK